MSVITHARKATTPPATVHLRDLNPSQRATFRQAIDSALDAHTNTAYFALQALAIRVTGIRTPASREITQCGCPTCYCDLVFDAAEARTYREDEAGPEVVQCPDCADDHRYGDQP